MVCRFRLLDTLQMYASAVMVRTQRPLPGLCSGPTPAVPSIFPSRLTTSSLVFSCIFSLRPFVHRLHHLYLLRSLDLSLRSVFAFSRPATFSSRARTLFLHPLSSATATRLQMMVLFSLIWMFVDLELRVFMAASMDSMEDSSFGLTRFPACVPLVGAQTGETSIPSVCGLSARCR